MYQTLTKKTSFHHLSHQGDGGAGVQPASLPLCSPIPRPGPRMLAHQKVRIGVGDWKIQQKNFVTLCCLFLT